MCDYTGVCISSPSQVRNHLYGLPYGSVDRCKQQQQQQQQQQEQQQQQQLYCMEPKVEGKNHLRPGIQWLSPVGSIFLGNSIYVS